MAARSAGVEEICRDYPAQLYPVGDVEALFKALTRFCAAPQEFQIEALGAAAKARQTFSSSQMARAYTDVYRQILEAK